LDEDEVATVLLGANGRTEEAGDADGRPAEAGDADGRPKEAEAAAGDGAARRLGAGATCRNADDSKVGLDVEWLASDEEARETGAAAAFVADGGGWPFMARLDGRMAFFTRRPLSGSKRSISFVHCFLLCSSARFIFCFVVRYTSSVARMQIFFVIIPVVVIIGLELHFSAISRLLGSSDGLMSEELQWNSAHVSFSPGIRIRLPLPRV